MNNRKGINRFLLTSASVIAIGFTSAALAAGGGGSVYLTQTGNSQSADIDQSGGTNNTVGAWNNRFIQENGAGSGSNVLTIKQNVGSFSSSGTGNGVTGWQSGTGNNADIEQGGSNSNVKLQQTGKGNGPSADNWFNNTFGNRIIQDSTTNYSTVNLTQTNSAGATNGNVFSIGQGGVSNTINATQAGYNKLWIRQGSTAPDLWAWTWGNPFSPSYTSNSLAALSNSTITINQTVGGSDPAQRNYAALGQGNGNNNHITVTQTGGSNSADVNQVGSDNTFSSTQTSTNGNVNWNFVGGEAGWPDSTFNPLTGVNGDFRPIAQIGNGNEYNSIQSGLSQLALGSQIGNNNFLTTTQSGEGNKLYTAQNGDGNDIYSVQSGTTNTASVLQNHNGSLTDLLQNGTSNAATIAQ